MRRTVAAGLSTLVASAAFASQLVGQGVVPGTETKDGIITEISIAVTDSGQAHPIARHVLLVSNMSGDTNTSVTSSSGLIAIALPKGEYHLVSASPAVWHGMAYSWSVAITVRSGIGIVYLTGQNAARAEVATQLSNAPGQHQYTGTPKDGTLAVILSFLVPGVGQMYAGAPGRGAVLLGIDLAGFGIAAAGGSHYARCACSTGQAIEYGGLALSVSDWIFSMVDAASTAHNYNERHGFVTSRVQPYIGALAGRTNVGLRITL